MRRIAVIGLGRFGLTLARRLTELGAQVIACDRSMPLVAEIRDHVDLAVRLDSTDREALIAQEIDKVDVCVVAIGENFEASLLTTVLVKKLGVPRVICRAQTAVHAEIFTQIGADEVIQPEMSAGEQTARRLANPRLNDVIQIAEGYSLVEIATPAAWCGRPLRELALRTKFDVNLVAIKREVPAPSPDETGRAAEPDSVSAPETPGREIISVPRPDDRLLAGDLLMLIGSDEAIDRLPRH